MANPSEKGGATKNVFACGSRKQRAGAHSI